MKNIQELDWQQIVGKKTKRNIFSPEGVLLIRLATQLTERHIQLLKQHGINLTSWDVETGDTLDTTVPQYMYIEHAVEEVKDLFEEIHHTRQIPLADFRQKIIPIIHDTVQKENFFNLFTSLQAKDDYTYRHNIAVGVLANLLGSWLGLEKKQLLQLTTAALLHDVGKMLIPAEILNKPGKLTGEEFEMMKKHTIYGYELLKNTTGISHRQALVALQHHERLDGSGYPFGITEEKIDLYSRIVAVVDVFHAMISKRVYRDASPFYEILIAMERDAFGVLDPKITKVFIEKVMNYLVGHSVLLTDGREGKIIMIHSNEPTLPLIQVGEQFVDLRRESLRLEKILA